MSTAASRRQSKPSKIEKFALPVAIVASLLVVALFLLLSDTLPLFAAYLAGFVFWWKASIGFICLGLIRGLVSSYWGRGTRGYLEAGLWTILLSAVLFLPLLLGMNQLYPWFPGSGENTSPATQARIETSAEKSRADVTLSPETVSTETRSVATESVATEDPGAGEATHHASSRHSFRAAYLQQSSFYWRAIAYFGIWFASSMVAYRVGRVHGNTARTRRFCAIGGVFTVIAVTFAAVDWGMSLDPAWYSTIYGGIWLVGSVVLALAWLCLYVAANLRLELPAEVRVSQILNDLGNLMLAFVMLWTYFSFSQYLIIWSGNLPSETTWYLERMEPGWIIFSIGLILIHFVLPFTLLLSREQKRKPKRLAIVARIVIGAQALETFWMIVPSTESHALSALLLYALVLIAMGGLWSWLYLRLLSRHLSSQPMSV